MDNDIEIIKPDYELGMKFDFYSIKAKGVDWKNIYKRNCLLLKYDFIEQGSMSDFEYFKVTRDRPKFDYYVIKDGISIGGAVVTKCEDSYAYIAYARIEEGYRGCGYGERLIAYVCDELLKDSSIKGVMMDDVSVGRLTSKIGIKLGFYFVDDYLLLKENNNYVKKKTK